MNKTGLSKVTKENSNNKWVKMREDEPTTGCKGPKTMSGYNMGVEIT